MSIQSMPVPCEDLETVQQNFSTEWAIHSSDPAPPPREQVVGQQQSAKGGGGQSEAALLQLHQQLSSCKECETFPKEIPPPPGRQGRKPREF